MKQIIFSHRPPIVITYYSKYAKISMDAILESTRWNNAWHPLTDEGEKILEKYICSIKQHVKPGSFYGVGRYSFITIRKEIIDDVAKVFQAVYRQHHQTITNTDILESACTGELLR